MGASRFRTDKWQDGKESKDLSGELAFQKQVDSLLLAEYTPPFILVNEDLEVVQFHGRSREYIGPKPEAANRRLKRVELPLDLRTAIDQSRKTEAPVIQSGVRVVTGRSSPHSKIREGSEARKITIEVRPFKAEPSGPRHFLVLFHDGVETNKGSAKRPDGAGLGLQVSGDVRVVEQLENSNERLRDANEEIQSSNEELRTINEELETAREELRVSNEKLTALNEELQNRNSELILTNNDLNNVISNATLPMIILGSDLRIRRFTTSAKKVLGLVPADVGRRLPDLECAADFPDLDNLVRQAVDMRSAAEREVLSRNGCWYSLRVRPYKTVENRIEGAVVTLVDITDLKSQASESHAYAHAIVESARVAILVLDRELRVKTANRSYFEQFRTSPEEVEGRFLTELGNGQWNIPEFLKLLKEILPEGMELSDFEIEHEFPHIGRRVLLLDARQIIEGPESGTLILLTIRDITDRNRTRRLIEEQAKLLDLADDVIIVRELSGAIRSWNRGAQRTYGWTREEALGKNKHEFLNTQPPELVEEQHRSLREKGSWRGELVHTTRDGEKITMSSRQVLQASGRGEPQAVLEINRDITAQKKTLEQLEEERLVVSQLSARLLQLQDEERRRIARELHDSTAQTLTALTINLALLEAGGIGKSDAKVKKLFVETQALAAQAADEIRNLSHLLHPPDLENAGLVAAVRWFSTQFTERSKITVHLDLPSQNVRWPAELEVALFRVAQESLMNIQRHSGSKMAKIRLYQQKKQLVLEIADEGHGIKTAPPHGHADEICISAGVGIAGMRERLRLLGGRLDVVSTGHGTTVKATVPVSVPTRISRP
ncbi:MAG: PAS domain S-box protein [Terriglobia bacterium]